MPEVIYGAGKTPVQIEEIARNLLDAGQNVLATRLNEDALLHLSGAFPEADMHPEARLMRIISSPLRRRRASSASSVRARPTRRWRKKPH